MPSQQNNVLSILPGSLLAACAVVAIAGCTPTVKVQAPDKPIEINMNIKIEQEVRVKVEKDLEDVFAKDPDLFGVK